MKTIRALGEKPVLVIAGPTASGKSSLAVEFALKLKSMNRRAEILCADSITVFRGFEIGAAKPTKEEQRLVPHHLIDMADPAEDFTAGDFVRIAQEKIAELHAKKIIPILVGGTGFYLRALLWGMASSDDEPEERAAAVKRALLKKAESVGWDEMYRELVTKDPQSVSTIHSNDHYRVIRALQAMELYGKPWSELNREARVAEPRYPDFRYFCLQLPKDELEARIRARTALMVKQGIEREVRKLLDAGVAPDAKPMRSVGYKEAVEAILGNATEELEGKIFFSTRKLAKAQMTWFRGERDVEWLEPEFLPALRSSLKLI
ncbi:MAG: tRNA (adenosine(37)-N6)-dimethylallyltransferase MiaA [Bacteriovoracia bacterium]